MSQYQAQDAHISIVGAHFNTAQVQLTKSQAELPDALDEVRYLEAALQRQETEKGQLRTENEQLKQQLEAQNEQLKEQLEAWSEELQQHVQRFEGELLSKQAAAHTFAQRLEEKAREVGGC